MRPPVVCDQARPARPLSNLRKLRFPMELAWGELISRLAQLGRDLSLVNEAGAEKPCMVWTQ